MQSFVDKMCELEVVCTVRASDVGGAQDGFGTQGTFKALFKALESTSGGLETPLVRYSIAREARHDPP